MMLVGFYFGEMGLNKQQRIDKAIDDLRLATEDPFFGKKFLCRTPLADGRFAYHGTDYPHHMADLVCAKHEFQARKAEREAMTNNIELINQARKELGIENTSIIARWQLNALEAKISEIKSREWVDELIATTNHWYDYKNQNALRFPPVGEVCLVDEYDKIEIVGETKDGYKVFKYVDTGFFGMACQLTSYKPLDWDNGLESIIRNHLDIEDYPVHKLISAILAAGYRKCNNKASSDKE